LVSVIKGKTWTEDVWEQGVENIWTEEGLNNWRLEKMHSEELHNLYSSPNIIRITKPRRMRWARHVTCMGEKRDACRILVGKQEGKTSLGRPRCRWEDNIKMDLRETE
jgi:hypothetical protein